MKHQLLIISSVVAAFVMSCTMPNKNKETQVELKTTEGTLVVKLYDGTPKHRDNFIKLAEEGYFDSLLFHRVIEDFMIQGGDPDSKNAEPGARLGNGGPGYKIEAEILPRKYYHKKGALSAARESDQVNPEKKSSGSQFYIVQGKTFSDQELQQMEQNVAQSEMQAFARAYLEKNQDARRVLDSFRQANDRPGFNAYVEKLNNTIKQEYEKDNEIFTYTDEQKEVYKTIGGTPHLDGGYTVFGEVVEGLEVIDTIAAVETDSNDRPKEDVMIISAKVLK